MSDRKQGGGLQGGPAEPSCDVILTVSGTARLAVSYSGPSTCLCRCLAPHVETALDALALGRTSDCLACSTVAHSALDEATAFNCLRLHPSQGTHLPGCPNALYMCTPQGLPTSHILLPELQGVLPKDSKCVSSHSSGARNPSSRGL